MIKREAYMRQIRPFIAGDLIKVLTGLRRSGKSVMLELIQAELKGQGISETQFVKLNFEDMGNTKLCTAVALRDEVLNKVSKISGKAYLFFDEKYVVSLDEFDMSRNGIKHKNIRDFLLMAEWD